VPKNPESDNAAKDAQRIAEEYRVLHKVAQILVTPGELRPMLKSILEALTGFEDLRVESKAGIFLADTEKKVLRLFVTYGDFSREFLDKEKEVPFGDCLCGRAAASGELLMSESCFTDPRHERTFSDMQAHGHYIVPLKSGKELVGVLFMYTDVHPAWYRHSQEVLLSIGGLVAGAILRTQVEQELAAYHNHLERVIKERARQVMMGQIELEAEIEEHKKTQEQLRRLSHSIQEVREEEKARISREVHDELGQSLTALKMDLLHLGKKFTDGETAATVRSMVALVDTTIASVQRIAMELRPPILDAFGLAEAIAWQAGEYQKRFGLAIDTRGLTDVAVVIPALKTALFRIFQESVTNVVRHAGASEVRLTLGMQDGRVRMTIEDDGCGIAAEKVSDSQSLGLIGMRERLNPFKGEISIASAPGQGTSVTVTVPLEKK